MLQFCMSPQAPTDSILDTLAEGVISSQHEIQSHFRAGHWLALAFRLKPAILIEAPQSHLMSGIPLLYVLWPDQSYLNPLDISYLFPSQGFAYIAFSA